MKPRSGEHVPWYRAPVAWLGIVVFVASLAGSAYNIVVSLELADDALTEVAPGGKFLLEPEE